MKGIMSLIIPVCFINIVKSTVQKLIRLCLITLLAFFISTTITYLFNIIVRVPSNLSKKIDFYIENEALVSEIYTNCLEEYEHNSNKNCLNLESGLYTILVELNIVKFYNNAGEIQDQAGLIETQLEFNSENNPKRDFLIKKVVFLKEENKIVKLIYDVVSIFPRLLGYLNSEKVIINFTSELNSSTFDLEKVKLTLFNKNITLDECKIMFLPNLSYLQYFMGKMYYISLFAVFFSVFFGIIISYLIYNIYYSISYFSGDKEEQKPQLE